MWIVTPIGFFNIIQYPEDRPKGLLTVKARSKEDLELFNKHLAGGLVEIEESLTADYRFRLKAHHIEVANAIGYMVRDIDYSKTKPAISAMFPERSGIYLDVWDILRAIQDEAQSSQGG